MKGFVKGYQKKFSNLINSIRVTDNQKHELNFERGIEISCKLIKRQSEISGRVFFIGNGGSAAIANHMAIDFWKNGGIQSMAFSDSSLLTSISNDFGYEHVFAKPIDFFADKKDILFAISSSGKSKNILKAVGVMLAKGAKVITLSGFHRDNPLSSKGVCNFYVPSYEYGLVEVIHQYICHLIFDTIIRHK